MKYYCLDVNNGSILWFYQGATENVGTLQSPAAIVYHDQVIYPFSLNEITGIDINNGQTSFQTSIPSYKLSSTNVNDIDITPVISNNNLYISTFSGDLAAINLATNEVEWSLTQAGAADGNAVWSSGDYLYSITKDGLLISVYKVTGTVRWLKDLKELPSEVKQKTGAIFSGPIMINNMLYVISSHGQVLVFSIVNGDLNRTIEIDSKKQYGPPIAVYNSLYSLANDGTLLQLK